MKYFSIIIPTYNVSSTIRQCLDSLLSQSFSDFEVLLMDNISTDTTLNIVKSYNDERIRIYSEKDSGVYDAMNKGIDKADGQWLFFLGSDDTLYNKDVLSTIANSIELNSPDIIYGNAYFVEKKYLHAGIFTRERLVKSMNICHQAIFYKRNLFDRLGKYNLNFKIYADWDFNIRCFSTPDLIIQYTDLTITNYNDSSGISASNNDPNFINVSSNDIIIRNQLLERENKNILNSANYKVGAFILKPIRFIYKIFK